MAHGLAPLARFEGEKGLAEIFFGRDSYPVIAVIAALPGKHMPVLVVHLLNAFLEVHAHGHVQRLVSVGQVFPAPGILKAALDAHGIEIRGDNAFGGQIFLVLVAMQGPASFGRRQALAHDHDAVLHVRGPGHGIIDHKAFLAVLVPAIPDGLGRKNVGAKGLGGELVVQGLPFVVIVVVLDAVRARIRARAYRRP